METGTIAKKHINFTVFGKQALGETCIIAIIVNNNKDIFRLKLQCAYTIILGEMTSLLMLCT